MDIDSPDSNLASLGSNPQLRFGKIEELGHRVSAAIAAARKRLFSTERVRSRSHTPAICRGPKRFRSKPVYKSQRTFAPSVGAGVGRDDYLDREPREGTSGSIESSGAP